MGLGDQGLGLVGGEVGHGDPELDVKGEAARRRGEAPSPYSIVGIDDYALGFRAGYFVRESPRSRSEQTDLADLQYLRSGR